MSKGVDNIGNKNSIQKAVKDVDLEYKKEKIAFAVQVSKLNTHRVQSPEEMQERISQMFDLCIQTGNLPSYESIAVACRDSY